MMRGWAEVACLEYSDGEKKNDELLKNSKYPDHSFLRDGTGLFLYWFSCIFKSIFRKFTGYLTCGHNIKKISSRKIECAGFSNVLFNKNKISLKHKLKSL